MAGDDAFQAIVGSVDGTMLVLTAAAPDGERSGCLVGFSTQAGIDPPRYLVCVSKANHTFDVAMDADVVAVHVLRAGDRAMARRFGEETGDEVDKFAGLRTEDGPGGAPVVSGLDWFAGRVLDRIDTGDHVALLLDPFDGSATRTGEAQLGFQDVTDLDPGHPA